MPKTKISGPAMLMYLIIGIGAIISTICLGLYYTGAYKSDVVLWVGIVAFMLVYHLWLRIIMGNVTKLFNINYSQRWFREKSFEKRLYKFLRVKKWKNKALTYNPELFSLKNYSLSQIANTMSKAETDHWINEVISLFSILFAFVWGNLWIFLATSIAAMIFEAQFIVIQRYNRPRIVRILDKQQNKKLNQVESDFKKLRQKI